MLLAPCVYRKVSSSVLKGHLLVFIRDRTLLYEPQSREYQRPLCTNGNTNDPRPTRIAFGEKIRHKPEAPPGLGACAEWPAATQEPGTFFFFFNRGHGPEKIRLSRHSPETLGRGSPGLAFEEKPNKLFPCPLTVHFRLQPHTSGPVAGSGPAPYFRFS